MYDPQSVPDASPEPHTFSIDLFPLKDLLDPIPEHNPHPQSLSIDLHPLHELLPVVPEAAPQGQFFVVNLHKTNDALSLDEAKLGDVASPAKESHVVEDTGDTPGGGSQADERDPLLHNRKAQDSHFPMGLHALPPRVGNTTQVNTPTFNLLLGPKFDDRPCSDLTGAIVKREDYFAYGAFSTVHLGDWTDPVSHTTKTVAVKCLRTKATEPYPEVASRRLARESKVWCRLNHPNILPFLGICHFGETLALVTPFCEFGDAVKYFKKNPNADRLKAVIGAAKGLNYLHSIKVPTAVIHGDLKTSNVLIDNDGVARLCDFGRARLVSHHGFTTNFSGTIPYLAPELLADNGPVDEDDETDVSVNNFVPRTTKESDVYAFSMVALEILSGKSPFYYFQPQTVIAMRVANGTTPWRKRYLSTALTGELWSLLAQCWDHRPELRLDMGNVVQRLTSA